MRWTDWSPTYLDIVQRLDLDVERDKEATELLTSLLENIKPKPLLERLQKTIISHVYHSI